MSDAEDWTGVTASGATVVHDGPYNPATDPPVTCHLLNTDRSLIVLCTPTFNADGLNVVGGTTGMPYSSAGLTWPPAPWGWVCPAYGVADPTVTVAVNGQNAARRLTVIAVPDEVAVGVPNSPAASRLVDLSGNLFGVGANPLRVESEVYSTHGVFGGLVAASGGQLALTAAPGAGTCWEVVSLSINGTGAPAAAGNVTLVGATSGVQYWGTTFNAAPIRDHMGPGVFYASEGLKVVNGLSVSVQASLIARTVPSH